MGIYSDEMRDKAVEFLEEAEKGLLYIGGQPAVGFQIEIAQAYARLYASDVESRKQ